MVAHHQTLVVVVEVPVTIILDLSGQELQQALLEALTPLVVQVIVIILAVVLEVELLVVAVVPVLVLLVVVVQLMLISLFKQSYMPTLHFNQLMQLLNQPLQPQI